MGSIGVAFRAFFKALFDGPAASRIEQALQNTELPKVTARVENAAQNLKTRPEPAAPKRSEALTLLAALQREARLVDLIQEPLGDYSDEQIGAAARSVLRDSAEVLQRFFALERAASRSEGETIDIPSGYDPSCYHLVGSVTGTGPFRGIINHAGWKATVVQLPTWTGGNEGALVIAPVEVEVG